MDEATKRRGRTEQTLRERWKELGFEALLVQEKQYTALWWLVNEVANGTFDQYFFNSSGDIAPLAMEGLKEVGATESLQILERAMAVFTPGEYPTDRETRWKGLDRIPREGNGEIKAFRELSDALLDNTEDFEGWTLDRIAEIYNTGLIDGAQNI